MARLLALLLACLFAVAPSADAVCKAACTPARATATSCHEMAAPAPDGRVDSGNLCRRDVLLAAPPGDTRRDAPAPAVMALSASTLATGPDARFPLDRTPRHVRPKATQAFPPCIVLRI